MFSLTFSIYPFFHFYILLVMIFRHLPSLMCYFVANFKMMSWWHNWKCGIGPLRFHLEIEMQIWRQETGRPIGWRTWGQKKGSVTHDWPKAEIRRNVIIIKNNCSNIWPRTSAQNCCIKLSFEQPILVSSY